MLEFGFRPLLDLLPTNFCRNPNAYYKPSRCWSLAFTPYLLSCQPTLVETLLRIILTFKPPRCWSLVFVPSFITFIPPDAEVLFSSPDHPFANKPLSKHFYITRETLQMLESGGTGEKQSGSVGASGRSKMTRLKNVVTPDNKGKSKVGLNGVGVSASSGDGDQSGGSSKKNEAKCAAGMIENVCLLGAPLGASAARWERVARMVHGRIINGYSKSDIILGLVFRAKSLSLSVAGIQKVRPTWLFFILFFMWVFWWWVVVFFVFVLVVVCFGLCCCRCS